jgi:hypothetical protein
MACNCHPSDPACNHLQTDDQCPMPGCDGRLDDNYACDVCDYAWHGCPVCGEELKPGQWHCDCGWDGEHEINAAALRGPLAAPTSSGVSGIGVGVSPALSQGVSAGQTTVRAASPESAA